MGLPPRRTLRIDWISAAGGSERGIRYPLFSQTALARVKMFVTTIFKIIPLYRRSVPVLTRRQARKLPLFLGICGQIRFRKFARKLDLVFALSPTDSDHEVRLLEAIAHQ